MASESTPARTRGNRREPSRQRVAREIDVAIELVAFGAAASVRLAGLPGAERLAARAAPHASEANVALRVERHVSEHPVVVVGPRMAGGQPAAR